MIREAYEMMAQEPWGFHPNQIARLTDWQIDKLYREPAIKRAEQFERERQERERSIDAIGHQWTVPQSDEPEWTAEMIREKPLVFKDYFFRKMTGHGVPYGAVKQLWEQQYAEFQSMNGN